VVAAERPLDDVVTKRLGHAAADRTTWSRHEVVTLTVIVDDVLLVRHGGDVSKLCGGHSRRLG